MLISGVNISLFLLNFWSKISAKDGEVPKVQDSVMQNLEVQLWRNWGKGCVASPFEPPYCQSWGKMKPFFVYTHINGQSGFPTPSFKAVLLMTSLGLWHIWEGGIIIPRWMLGIDCLKHVIYPSNQWWFAEGESLDAKQILWVCCSSKVTVKRWPSKF